MQPRAVIVANPAAGGGRARHLAKHSWDRLNALGVDTTLHLPESLHDLAHVLKELGEGEAVSVIACGGDGTVHQVLQTAASHNMPLGIIPAGTGNDIARSLGIPPKAKEIDSVLSKIAGLLHGNKSTRVDANIIRHDTGSTWSLGVISAGFDSAVNERANHMTRGQGTVRYVLALLAELVPFNLHHFEVCIDGEPRGGSALLIAVGNGGSYGGGMRICPNASMTDGLLEITWVDSAPRRTVLRLFPHIYSGRHVHHDLVHTYRATEISFLTPDSMIYADGEPVGTTPVRINVRPKSVTILWESPG